VKLQKKPKRRKPTDRGRGKPILVHPTQKPPEAKPPEAKPPEATRAAPSLHQQLLSSVENFLNDVECASEMFETIVPILAEKDKERIEKSRQLIAQVTDRLKGYSAGPTKPQRVDMEWAVNRLGQSAKLIGAFRRGDVMFRRHSIVLLVSRLDEFVAQILRISYQAFPERLRGSAKTLSFDELLGAKSIQEVFLRFADKEIDRLLRQSQEEIIGYLDDQFKIGIKDQFLNYASFLEVTERRNLFVHTGGVVTPQYLDSYDKLKLPKDQAPKLGQQLEVPPGYYVKAAEIFIEIGLRIGQGIVRRLFPKELEAADVSLNAFGFDLLVMEKWDLAKLVFEFAIGLPEKFVSQEQYRRLFLINLAIACKWGSEPARMTKLLDTVDWSAAHPKFVVAQTVLRGDFEKSANIMSAMTPEMVSEDAFRTWPVFREFRASTEFANAFKKLFGKDFVPQIPTNQLQASCIENQEQEASKNVSPSS
jgi:hypothetical protein